MRIARKTIGRCMCVCVLLAAGLTTTNSIAQQSTDAVPIVTHASVPFYPELARAARIAGVVRLLLSTDGKRVSSVTVKSGPPMLIPAAEENVRTWEFKDHLPTKFTVTFQYKVLPESACAIDDGTVVLRLPTEVEISASGVQTCDPPVDSKSGSHPSVQSK
jgi:outer membrane biosynthesis protein TonB